MCVIIRVNYFAVGFSCRMKHFIQLFLGMIFHLSCFLLIVLGLLFILPVTNKVQASVLFQDNFEGGDLDKWQVDRNMQWGNPSLPCMDGGSPAEWVNDGGKVRIKINGPSCVTELVPVDSLWDNGWRNYVLEVDMTFVNGTDKGLLWRYEDNGDKWYGIHFVSPAFFDYVRKPPGGNGPSSSTFPLPNGNTYHMRVEMTETNMKTYIDGVLRLDYTFDPVNDIFPTGKIALHGSVGAVSFSEVVFDNVVVCDHFDSPCVPISKLDVPAYSQRDQEWNEPGDIYDNALEWDDFNNPTFANYACALTSTAMVLRYYGHDELPNGTGLNPESLNNLLNGSSPETSLWMRNGWMPFPTIAGLTEYLHDPNDPSSPPLLEYLKFVTSDFSEVAKYLQPNNPLSELPIPDIIEVKSDFSPSDVHFEVVVGKEDENTLLVIDPNDSPESVGVKSFETSDYDLVSIRRFYKPNSNLSYLMAHFDDELSPFLIGPGGQRVGVQGGSEFSEPENSWFNLEFPYFPQVSMVPSTVSPSYEIGVPKPPDGAYQLILKTEEVGLYEFELYFYDEEGQVVASKEEVFVSPDEPTVIGFDYSQQPRENDDLLERDITFEQILAEIEYAEQNGMITNHRFARRLSAVVKIAEVLYPEYPKLSEGFLKLAQGMINYRRGHFLTEEGYGLLSGDLGLLIESL